MCAPDRISRMAAVFSDITFIMAHMGGMRWQDAINTASPVDISSGLLDLCDLYGIEGANRILRKFGVDRLIFASDYPFFDHDAYYAVLDKMDFTDAEIEQIAHGNLTGIFEVS